MKRTRKNGDTSPSSKGAPRQEPAVSFSFGAPRYVSRGPRRLFAKHCATGPADDPAPERPGAILRLRTGVA